MLHRDHRPHALREDNENPHGDLLHVQKSGDDVEMEERVVLLVRIYDTENTMEYLRYHGYPGNAARVPVGMQSMPK